MRKRIENFESLTAKGLYATKIQPNSTTSSANHNAINIYLLFYMEYFFYSASVRPFLRILAIAAKKMQVTTKVITAPMA